MGLTAPAPETSPPNTETLRRRRGSAAEKSLPALKRLHQTRRRCGRLLGETLRICAAPETSPPNTETLRLDCRYVRDAEGNALKRLHQTRRRCGRHSARMSSAGR